MEASLFDMELLGSWDLAQLLAPDVLGSEHAGGPVLPGLSSHDGPWSLVDPYGSSPVDEVLQDSLWLDSTDGIGGAVFTGLQHSDLSHKKLCTDFLFDDDAQALTSDHLLVSDHLGSPASAAPELSPPTFDVKFEFGDVLDNETFSYLAATSPRAVDSVYAQQTLPQYDHSTSFSPCRPHFVMGSFDDDSRERDLALDSSVPTSPFNDSGASSLESLECDDDDSLHDAENVCQLLKALDGGDLHGAGGFNSAGLLSHVSPEEIESVLSRDSSSDDLTTLCEGALALSNASFMSRELAVGRTNGFQVKRDCTVISTAVYAPAGAALSSVASRPVSRDSIDSTVSLPSVLVSEYTSDCLGGKMASARSTVRSAPYGEVQSERRVRKKEQNKTAALRYRQKKREEKGHTMTEVEVLEQQNQALKNRAEELNKEISYLKGLLEEIRR